MKKQLLLAIFVLASFFLGAQSIEIYDLDGNIIPAGQDYVVKGNAGDFLAIYLKVKNVSGNPVDVKFRKQVLETFGEIEISFCWAGACLPSHINESPGFVTIQPGEFSAENLGIEISTEVGQEGIAKVAMTAFDSNNPSDSTRIVVVADYYTSINEANKTHMKMYPNPTNGELTITGGYGKTVTVFNAIGQLIYSQLLNSDQELLDLSFMKSGIYMVRLTENGKIIETKKLIKQ
ncbi:MAG TPA: T9SS type A sorting domain-containing protein [Salinivirgaceae bacterium]|nr:T9SS type A sorting domain-containing protein [Salinivirgaceae bacterium]